jgi:glycosyltransferase involved in cell wall biosynthesis
MIKAKSRKIFSWQTLLTDHQAFTYQELSALYNIDFIAYSFKLEDKDKHGYGWKKTVFKNINLRIIPSGIFFLPFCSNVIKNNINAIHIINSPFDSIKIIYCLFLCSFYKVDFYIISEPFSSSIKGYHSKNLHFFNVLKYLLRPLIYKIYYLFFLKNAKGIFAISPASVIQYSKLGINIDKIFPFGYFVPKIKSDKVHHKLISGKTLHLCFVGSLIPRKNLKNLIYATQYLNNLGYKIKLDIFGKGDIWRYKINNSYIKYKGEILFGKAQLVIQDYDMLVVPSAFDGWGVVVNEAIFAQTPILCSDKTGSKILIETYNVGLVFKTNDQLDFISKLKTVYENRQLLKLMSKNCQKASRHILPKVAASFMHSKFNEINSFAPWYPKL